MVLSSALAEHNLRSLNDVLGRDIRVALNWLCIVIPVSVNFDFKKLMSASNRDFPLFSSDSYPMQAPRNLMFKNGREREYIPRAIPWCSHVARSFELYTDIPPPSTCPSTLSKSSPLVFAYKCRYTR